MTNSLLQAQIIKRAAQIIFQSYNTILVEDAFYMAVGEAEVEFDTDIKITFNDSFENQINSMIP